MNKDLNNIFYKPSINVDKNYRTDGYIKKNTEEVISNDYIKKTPSEKLLAKAEENLDNLIDIKKISDIFPEKTKKIIQDIVDNLIIQNIIEIEEIDKIIENEEKDEEEKKHEEIYEDSIPGEIPDSSTETIDYDLADPEPVDLIITVKKTKELSELAKDQQLKDSTLIKEHFIMKMKDVIQEFVYPTANIIQEAGLSNTKYLNIEYDGKMVTGYDNDSSHLNDLIVKNQIILREKELLFQKTHSNHITLGILTAFNTVSEERIRYYAEKYSNAITNYLDMYKRNTLEKIRKEYDAKYNKSKANMYKYLNSSVIITSDILKATLNTYNAKCYLLTQNVNIFAREEFEEIGYTNASGNSSKELIGNNNTNNATNNTTNNNTNSNNDNKTSNSSIEDVTSKVTDTVKDLTDKIGGIL